MCDFIKKQFAAYLCLLVGGLLACAPGVVADESEAPVLLDGVAAHVDQHVITVGEVLTVMEPVRRQLVGAYSGEELRERLRVAYRDALMALIERRLVLDAYETGPGRIPEWAVDSRANETIEEAFAGDRSALLDALSRENLTVAEWRKRLQEQIAFSSMRTTSVEQHVTIPPEAVAQFYQDHLEQYQTSEKLNLRMIVVRKPDGDPAAGRQQMDALLARIQQGEAFADVAQEASVGVNARQGGDWGWVEPTVLRPELAEAVVGLAPGSLSPIIETTGEYYLIKLEDRREPGVRPFVDVQAEIERELRLKRVQELYTAWIARLRDQAAVRVRDDIIPF